MTELTPPPLQLACIRCGHKMPALSEDERRLFLSAGGTAIAQHPPGQCPPDLERARAALDLAGAVDLSRPRERTFEAHVTITELTGDLSGEGTADREVVTDFVATASAPSATVLMAAGGPLAQALGEKWMLVAEHIGFADVPAVPSAPDPSL